MNKKKQGLMLLGMLVVDWIFALFFMYMYRDGLAFPQVIYLILGQGLFYQRTDAFTIIILLMPQMLLLFGCSSALRDEVTGLGPYLFTRMKSRTKWYLQRAVRLIGLSFLLCAAYQLGALLLALLFGFRGAFPAAGMLLELYLIQSLQWSCVVLIANTANLRVRAIYTYVVGIFLLGVAMVAHAMSYQNTPLWLLRASPFAQGIYAWHDNAYQGYQIVDAAEAAQGFSVWGSVGYFVIFILLILSAGALVIRRTDILGRERD